ncbi:MAG TPA: hypothetical protein VIN08_20725 [Ohtaekwangia sp.]|uniref:hypothetical protein n=1 Tax=Ohtaekwangia sp. TaxID=2066019 RepID=UPI002F91C69D
MSNSFARLLRDQEQVEQFLTISLGIDVDDYPDIAYHIINSEKGVMDGLENPTSTIRKFRDRNYATDEKRLTLRKRIVDELFTKRLLSNDDRISLGKGGGLPTKVKRSRQAFILIGLPASGKSSVAKRIAEKYGAIILDTDLPSENCRNTQNIHGEHRWLIRNLH